MLCYISSNFQNTFWRVESFSETKQKNVEKNGVFYIQKKEWIVACIYDVKNGFKIIVDCQY